MRRSLGVNELRKYLEYGKQPAKVKSIIQSPAWLDYGFAFREMVVMKTESIALFSCAGARVFPARHPAADVKRRMN
jgi:hypothetical protein